MFGGGLRSLVAAAKSAAGAAQIPHNTPNTAPNTGRDEHLAESSLFPLMGNRHETEKPPSRSTSPTKRPYSLLNSLVDTIKTNKTPESEHDGGYPQEDYKYGKIFYSILQFS